MKVLFITRKYPPSKGGMEQISYGVISNFPELSKAKVISWGRSQKGLIFFIPWAFLKSLCFITLKKVELIHLGDAALSFMGYVFKKIFKIPVVVTVHGLDMTYENRLYQRVIRKTLKQLDHVICVSNASKSVAISKGVRSDNCTVIHNGIDTSSWRLSNNKNNLRRKLQEELKLDLNGKFLLLSVGRLIKRKGINWFIKNVFIKLKEECIFLIVGSGEEEQRIKETIQSLKFKNRIIMLGKISDEALKLLYNSADAFIMPNIPVEGDMEGFGIVAIEAASCGLPVVASNLEGIKDAIKDGKNGFLVQPYNAELYVKKINKVEGMKGLSGFKKRQIGYTSKNYDLKNISYKYYSLFKKLL